MDNFTAREKLQIDKSLQVFQMCLINPKMTLATACANVGIDPKTYRKWIATQDDAIAEIERVRQENEREEYAKYLIGKGAITDKFIRDALKPDISITEQIKALEHINQRIDELSGKYQIVDVEAEQDLLSGPRQQLGISSLANKALDKPENSDISPDTHQ